MARASAPREEFIDVVDQAERDLVDARSGSVTREAIMCEGVFEFWISPRWERSWDVFQQRKAAIKNVASLRRGQTGRSYWYREVDAADVAELAWVMNRLLEIARDYGTAVPIMVVAPGSAQPTAATDVRSEDFPMWPGGG